MARRALTSLVGGTAALLVLAAAACSLGLDESLIDKAKDAGFVAIDAPAAETGAVDAGVVDTGTPEKPDGAATCATDNDCTSSDGCLRGKCDTTRKRCVLELCKPSACNVGTCNEPAHSCGAPTPYKYKATQFTLPSPLACVKCAAAVYPWLYVVTTSGLVAYDVSNPANAKPATVPITGLGFLPSALVVSGSRLWMLGPANGAGPSRVPIAYIDSPANPFAKSIPAESALATSNRPSEAPLLLPRGGDSVLLVSPADGSPSVAVEAPVVEPLTLTSTALVLPANFAPSAVSGKRLLASSVAGQAAGFTFVDNAGSTTPATGPVSTLADAGAVSTSRAFAQSADGAIFWATAVHRPDATTRAVRGYFLVPGETAPIDMTAGVDVEVYPAQDGGVAANAAVLGGNAAGVAMVDAKTAMVATQARDDDGQTAVQFVRRDPLGVIKDGDIPRRVVVGAPINSIVAATASNGVAYLVANDKPTSATVHVFDPACAR